MKIEPRIIYSSALADSLEYADPHDFRDDLDREEDCTEEETKILVLQELSLQAILAIAQSGDKEVTIGRDTYSREKLAVRLKKLCCDPRRIIALMLYAADHPDWAWVNFWKAFCPEMTNKDMAMLRKIPPSTVKYHLDNVELPSDAYEFIPENN